MAKNSYRLLFSQMGEGDRVIETHVIVENRGDLLVTFRLPREPSYKAMDELRQKVSNDKPPVLIRNTVAAWVQQLSRRKG